MGFCQSSFHLPFQQDLSENHSLPLELLSSMTQQAPGSPSYLHGFPFSLTDSSSNKTLNVIVAQGWTRGSIQFSLLFLGNFMHAHSFIWLISLYLHPRHSSWCQTHVSSCLLDIFALKSQEHLHAMDQSWAHELLLPNLVLLEFPCSVINIVIQLCQPENLGLILAISLSLGPYMLFFTTCQFSLLNISKICSPPCSKLPSFLT